MPWTTPGTAVAGSVLTAAYWNTQVRDNLNDHETYVAGIRTGFVGYTPTLTQLGNVPKTVNVARYQQVGKLVTVYFEMSVTGAGGTGGNRVSVSLPVTARSGITNVFTPLGKATIYDASSTIVYPGLIVYGDTSTVHLVTTQSAVVNSAQYLGVTDFTAALASSDIVGGSFSYEAA